MIVVTIIMKIENKFNRGGDNDHLQHSFFLVGWLTLLLSMMSFGFWRNLLVGALF